MRGSDSRSVTPRVDLDAQPHTSGEDSHTTPSPASRPPDIMYTLWFEQLKQLSTVAVAATAGVLILLQMGFARVDVVSISAVVSVIASLLLSMDAQDALIDLAAEGLPPNKLVRVKRRLAGLLLIGGAAAFLGYNFGLG